MKYTTILLVLAASLPVISREHNTELGLFVGTQSYQQRLFGENYMLSSNSSLPVGIRFAYTWACNGSVGIQANVASFISASNTFYANGIEMGDQSHEAFALGISTILHATKTLDVNLGLDYRVESMKLDLKSSKGTTTGEATLRRPWLKANTTYSFEQISCTPFVGIECAVPLMTAHITPTSSSVKDDNQSFIASGAPKFQFGVYGGVKF